MSLMFTALLRHLGFPARIVPPALFLCTALSIQAAERRSYWMPVEVVNEALVNAGRAPIDVQNPPPGVETVAPTGWVLASSETPSSKDPRKKKQIPPLPPEELAAVRALPPPLPAVPVDTSAHQRAELRPIEFFVGTTDSQVEAPGLSEIPSGGGPAAGEIGTLINSISFSDVVDLQEGYAAVPPDCHGAAGPRHLVAVVNTVVAFHDKISGVRTFATGLDEFFASLSPASNPYDPRVVYDQYAERFVVIASIFDNAGWGSVNPDNSASVLMAVSSTSDPHDPWHFYALDVLENLPLQEIPENTIKPHFIDYPALSVGEESVFITGNLYSFPNWFGFSYRGGHRLYVMDKGLGSGGFYDGGPPVYSTVDSAPGGSIRSTKIPAHTFGSPAAPEPYDTYLVSYSGKSVGDEDFLEVMAVDDDTYPATLAGPFLVSLGNIDDQGTMPPVPQADVTTTITANDRRALDAVLRGGSLWGATTYVPNDGPDNGEATAMLFEIDTTGPALTLSNLVSIGGEGISFGGVPQTGVHTFFPSLAVDAENNVVSGLSASSATMYASSCFTRRNASDPFGHHELPTIIQEGDDDYVRTYVLFAGINRWGDYSGCAIDPIDDTAWIYQQAAWTHGNPVVLSSGNNQKIEVGRYKSAFLKAHVATETYDEYCTRIGLVAPDDAKGDDKDRDGLVNILEQYLALSATSGDLSAQVIEIGRDPGGTFFRHRRARGAVDVTSVAYRIDDSADGVVNAQTGTIMSEGIHYHLDSVLNNGDGSETVKFYLDPDFLGTLTGAIFVTIELTYLP